MFLYVTPKTKSVGDGTKTVLFCGDVVQSKKTLISLSITECHKKTVFMVSYQAILKLN